jgi:2-oxo-hept-3-ene-1,7-dioate hydratase
MLIISPHLLSRGHMPLSTEHIRAAAERKGDTIQADYGAYGSVSCHFG